MKRYMFRNERKFYKVVDINGKPQISTIAPEMNLRVMSRDQYFDHDNTQYGREYS